MAHNSLLSQLHSSKSNSVLCYTSLLCIRDYQTPRSSRQPAAQRVQQVDLSKEENINTGLGILKADKLLFTTVYSTHLVRFSLRMSKVIRICFGFVLSC